MSPTQQRRVALVLALMALVALGFVRVQLLLWRESQDTLASQVGHTVTLAGRVTEDPSPRTKETQVVLDVATIDGVPARGKVLVYASPSVAVQYGDTLTFKGVLEVPAPFAGDDGRTFDYPQYLRVSGISAVMQKPTIVSRGPSGVSVWREVYALKHAFEHSLQNIFMPDMAALVAGVLLGERHGLPSDIQQVLVAAGLIHIVILAGYALTLVSQGVLDALQFLHPRTRYVLAALLLVLYVVMTGAAATTVRACMMAIVAMMARVLHRSTVALRSLFFVAATMFLYNPLYIFDVSFIVSVTATFGLITLAPLCERLLQRIPERFDLRGIAASTLAVQIFALPLILYYTGTLSLWALPANLLALPALPWTMLFGFVAGALAFVHPAFALVPALIAQILMRYMLLVAQGAASLPLGGATVPTFPFALLVLVYVPLGALAVWSYKKFTFIFATR